MYWDIAAAGADERARALRVCAEKVFQDARMSERWLERQNSALSGHRAPVAACATAHGFFEAMAELARIESLEQREARKRARFGERGRSSYIRLSA